MITVDFSSALTCAVTIILGILIVPWFFARKQKDKEVSLDPRYLWFCSVCTYTYINTKEDTISMCPRCSSYNKKES